MRCERCQQNEATVFTTSIVNGVASKSSLCDSCYASAGFDLPLEKGVIQESSGTVPLGKIDLELLKAVFGRRRAGVDLDRACPHCGNTLGEFKKRRVVGCARDYEVFREEIDALLVRLHGASRHVGRLPPEFEMRRIREHRVSQLKSELKEAVDGERYEEAARLRDRIDALERAGHDRDS